MLTLDALRAYGADVDSGLRRCMSHGRGPQTGLIGKNAAGDTPSDSLTNTNSRAAA